MVISDDILEYEESMLKQFFETFSESGPNIFDDWGQYSIEAEIIDSNDRLSFITAGTGEDRDDVIDVGDEVSSSSSTQVVLTEDSLSCFR